MVSKHTIHHSKNKWDKASPLSKTSSSFQRKVNNLQKQLREVNVNNRLKKIQLSNFSRFMDYLIKDNRITKEEIKRFLTTKKQELENMKYK